MNVQEYVSEVSSRLALRTSVVYAFAASLVTNVVLAAGIASIERQERIIVLPAETTKSFWLDNKTVSPDYLEQMSIFALQLALNNSPETFDYNVKKLLSYVAPEDRGETELQLVGQGRRLKASNASVHFMPESVEVRPAKLQAAVTGSIRQFIGNSKTSSMRKCWTVQFSYLGSRLWINTIRESDCRKPFEPLSEDKKGATS